MNILDRTSLLLLFLILSQVAVGQIVTPTNSLNSTGKPQRIYDIDNEFSINEIRQDDKMFQISVWRRINLKEKFNLGLYGSGSSDAKENGIINNIAIGIRKNEIPIYASDDFKDKLDIRQFDSLFSRSGSDTLLAGNYYYLDFKEDFVFDQRHSRHVFDIKYIQLVRPPEFNSTGMEEAPILYIKFKDLITYFDKYPSPNAVWINYKNSSEPLTYRQAFAARKFRSSITKYTNELDGSVLDLVNKNITDNEKRKMQAYLDGLAFEYKLLDFENSLWEW